MKYFEPKTSFSLPRNFSLSFISFFDPVVQEVKRSMLNSQKRCRRKSEGQETVICISEPQEFALLLFFSRFLG